jgi:hypothetical protein
MTKTSLSVATWSSPKAQRVYSAPQRRLGEASNLVRDARGVQWHRHSCLCAVAKPIVQQIAEATLSLPSKILIANPRLTLRVDPIRISNLKIPNRKFSTILRSAFRIRSLFDPQGSGFGSLIENARLRSSLTPSRISQLEISNRERMAMSHLVLAPAGPSAPVTDHESLPTSHAARFRCCSSLVTRH